MSFWDFMEMGIDALNGVSKPVVKIVEEWWYLIILAPLIPLLYFVARYLGYL